MTTGKNQGKLVFHFRNPVDFSILLPELMKSKRKRGKFRDDHCMAAGPTGGCDYLSEMKKPILGSSLCVGYNLFREKASTKKNLFVYITLTGSGGLKQRAIF